MWPLFLFGRLYSSDINYVTRFSRLRMPHAKTHVATTFDHVPIYVLKIGRLTPIAYGVQQWITRPRERERIFTLDSYNFSVSTPMLKIETTIFAISKLLTGQDNLRSNPTAINACGVGSGRNMRPHNTHVIKRDGSEVCYDSGSPHLANWDSERAFWTLWGKTCRDSPPPPSFFVQTSFCVARLGSHPILNILFPRRGFPPIASPNYTFIHSTSSPLLIRILHVP